MITFALTEDQQLVQETARKFAAEELRPRLRHHEKHGVPDELRGKLSALGLTLVDVPEAVGGGGMGALTAALVHEELAAGDPGSAVAVWSPHLVPAALVELGTPEQATRWLAKLGDGRGAVAWSEVGKLPAEGFATTARPDGDGWVLDGEKAFVINGDGARVVVVFAQTGEGWGGISAFVLDGDQVTSGTRHRWLGLETVVATTVSLKGARAEKLDGDVAAIKRFFARAQLVTAARQVGLARASYEFALAYTQDRRAFGKVVAHFQAISFTLADMHMDVESARWMVWRAAWELDSGAPGAAASVAKALVHANDAAWRVADNGVQLLGGAGFVQDYPVEKWMRDTKTLALLGGTDQLAQLEIAATYLGADLGTGLPIPQIQPVVT